jgi:TRAP-type C4-dicarboxylate transport system permease small subunit
LQRRLTLDPLVRPLVRVCEFVGIAIAGYFCIALFAAVVMRYVFNRSFGWIDELSSILLAWVMFVVGAIGFNERIHIAAEGFIDRFPLPLRRAVAIAVQVVVGAFFAVVGYYGWFVAQADMIFTMASIPIQRGLFLFVIPAASAIVVLICANNILKLWQGESPVAPKPEGETDVVV